MLQKLQGQPQPAPFDNIARAANGFAGSNVTGWVNRDYDRLHFQALGQLDAGARAETIKKMQEIFNDELPFIPLYERVEILAALMFISLLIVIFNLLADIAYAVVDPRIRYE